MTPEEWAALIDQAVTVGLPGAAEAQFAILLADAVVQESEFSEMLREVPHAGAVLLPSEPEPTIEEEEPVEIIDEDTPDTRELREARYLARKRGSQVGTPGARRRPTMRVWDEPGDLQYQDVGEERPVKEGGPLSQGDGSIRVVQG